MTDWTAPSPERVDPPRISPERQALDSWLDFHHTTLLTKCSGLTPPQLKERAIPPSGLSLLGLVRHMTEVERWWFRMHADRDGLDPVYGDGPEDFDDLDSADAAADIDTYKLEIEAARSAVAGKELDEVVPSRGHHPENTRDIRWIYIHMIEEYARHNGHADLLRECIDGTVGE